MSPLKKMLVPCRRLWPGSLFGQLSVIVVVGGLAVQVLFSSIWYDVRYSQVLEVPARLLSVRTVDTLKALERGEPLSSLATKTFHPELLTHPRPTPARLEPGQHNVARMFKDALQQELGHPVTVELLGLDVRDEHGHSRTWAGLFGLSKVVGHFDLQIKLASNRWLHIQAVQEQGWNARPAWAVLLDYVLRVYLLRALALVAVALIVVRLSTRPLRRLTRAATALGQNLAQPPLKIEGPKEMRQAAETFNTMQQQLLDVMNERTQLMAAVSHDLRTPLTRMRLRAETLPDERHRAKLIANIDQMDELIRALLDSASAGATPDSHHAFDLTTLIEAVAEEFEETGSAVHCTRLDPATVTGHAASLRRVLHNLIENALRYAGSAELSLTRAEAWVNVTITDTGPGIDEHTLEHLTTPFVQGEAATSASALGYGLGLSIARSIVMAHRGRLSLENRPGGGLKVVMALPAC